MERYSFNKEDVEYNCYHWHPLFKYVEEAKLIFSLAVCRAKQTNSIDELTYNCYSDPDSFGTVVDFNTILSFIEACYNGVYDTPYKGYFPVKHLLDIFKPLDINCYNGMALFKYKNFIALDEMDMFGQDFWDLHNGLYRECRSVVVDIKNSKLVLAPQPKFHNVDENDKWSVFVIHEKIAHAKKVEITNKLDGSNQNYRYYNGDIVGSGSSALNPSTSWRLAEGYKLLTDGVKNLLEDFPEYTFMFEYISPKNQIVVNYAKEDEGIYLFGARNVLSGREMSYEDVLHLAHKYGVKTTEIYDDSFDDIMNKLDDYKADEKEGWVIGITDDNNNIFKAKLKVNDYVLIHKALSKLISPNAIIKAIADDKWDDFYSKVPVAYRDNANEIKEIVVKYVYHMSFKISEYQTLAAKELGNMVNDKKSYMIWCYKNIPKSYRGYVISKYNGKSVNFLTKSSNGYKKLSELLVKEN